LVTTLIWGIFAITSPTFGLCFRPTIGSNWRAM
jgi:hypothetical protein